MGGRSFLQPAEWAPQRACWTALPCDGTLWGPPLAAAQAEVVALCRHLGRHQPVRLLVPPAPRPGVAAALPDLAALRGLPVEQISMAYGDIWLRDTAPIFVHDGAGQVHAACFAFNGWGGKYRLAGDAELRGAIAAAAAVPRHEHAMVLEGGAVETDGEGTFLTSRQCLLNPNREGPGDPAAVAEALREALGCERLLWVDDGLRNDHTDGHIDTLARFVAPGVVACMVPAADDPNRDVLTAVSARLAAQRDARGRPLAVREVPSPGAVRDTDGALMPASYLNFVLGNGVVVVPTYGVAADADAVAAVGALFPGRTCVGSSARAILAGGGALHCITQHEPLPR